MIVFIALEVTCGIPSWPSAALMVSMDSSALTVTTAEPTIRALALAPLLQAPEDGTGGLCAERSWYQHDGDQMTRNVSVLAVTNKGRSGPDAV